MLDEIRKAAQEIDGYITEEIPEKDEKSINSLKFSFSKLPSHDDQLKLERAGNVVRVTCFGSCESKTHTVYVSF